MEFSAEQKRVITSRGRNLLVSAAAGSGKTTVLVERVLALVDEGVNIDEILIVTFTRAASADMKRKLRERMSALADAGSWRMKEQLERMELAQISTLHSFCAKAIRACFQLVNVDPAFGVLEDAENQQLEQQALSEALEEAYLQNSSDMQALAAGRGPEEIKQLALSLYEFLCARPDVDAWLGHALSLLDTDGTIWTDALLQRAQAALGEAEALLNCAVKICNAELGPAHYLETLEGDLDFIHSLQGQSYEGIQASYLLYVPARAPGGRHKCDKEKLESVKELRKRAKRLFEEEVKKLTSLSREASLDDMRKDAPALQALFSLTQDMMRRQMELKREKGALSFNDLERLTLEVLKDDDAREKLRARFRYVFVDEYQDTSDMQEAIVSAIAREDGRFMVGDVKQSIYRFRNAEPALFMDAYMKYALGGPNELIVLDKNFRSRPAVLEFANLVFSRVMNGGVSEILYDDNASLKPGGSFEGEDPPVELMLVDAGDGGEAEGADDAPEDDDGWDRESARELKTAEREAELIARRIQELMQQSEGEDPKNRLQYKDICVITRVRRNVLSQMAGILAAHGIPAYADESESCFDALEVMVTVNALRLLVSRREELALLSVLRSPMFDVSSSELAYIRVKSPDVPWWQAVQNAKEDNPKIARFCELAAQWEALNGALSLCRLIRRILSDTGLYLFVSALPGGRRRAGNLDLLCQMAQDYEARQGGSLSGFLEYLDGMKESQSSAGAQEVGEGDDVVKLITAHKSKGLEYKVVFAAMLGRAYGRGGKDSGLWLDKQLGAGFEHIDTALGSVRGTLATKAMSALNRQRDVAEELRVLYVTMTRAMERLILVGSADNLETARAKYQAAQEKPDLYNSALDICAAAAYSCPGCEALGGTPLAGRPFIDLKIVPAGDIDAPAEETEARSAHPVEELLSREDWSGEEEELLLWRYQSKVKPDAPLKLSVTGLEKDFTGPAQMPRLIEQPAFLSGEDSLVYTERGTALHRALRALDYAPFAGLSEGEALSEAKRQLEQFCAGQLLSAKELTLIDPKHIARFALGEVGQRVLKSPKVQREWRFSMLMDTRRVIPDCPEGNRILVQGAIDLCFLEDGQWVLCDYKTNFSSDDEALIARYQTQLSVYREALESLTGLKVKEVLLCLPAQNRCLRVETHHFERAGQ